MKSILVYFRFALYFLMNLFFFFILFSLLHGQFFSLSKGLYSFDFSSLYFEVLLYTFPWAFMSTFVMVALSSLYEDFSVIHHFLIGALILFVAFLGFRMYSQSEGHSFVTQRSVESIEDLKAYMVPYHLYEVNSDGIFVSVGRPLSRDTNATLFIFDRDYETPQGMTYQRQTTFKSSYESLFFETNTPIDWTIYESGLWIHSLMNPVAPFFKGFLDDMYFFSLLLTLASPMVFVLFLFSTFLLWYALITLFHYSGRFRLYILFPGVRFFFWIFTFSVRDLHDFFDIWGLLEYVSFLTFFLSFLVFFSVRLIASFYSDPSVRGVKWGKDDFFVSKKGVGK